ncbi:hypothetical protein IIM_01664 [Bacillus cereus VD107]|nr:hypothetical protein IIM_01664 [Bacillus cereus VD107]
MKKILLHPLLISCIINILLLIILTYYIVNHSMPAEFNQNVWHKTEELAKKETIKHFKKEKNIDIVIDEIILPTEHTYCEIYINGHVAGHTDKKLSATVYPRKHYKVKENSYDKFCGR